MFLGRLIKALERRFRAARALRRASGLTRARLERGGIRRVLVLCYGNIYRSAYIAEYLRVKLAGRIEVRGGGFHKVVGRPSPEAHVRMCAQRGISLEAHRSRCVEAADLEWADTIVLMDRHNWLALDAMGADPAKLVWAGVLAGGPVEIVDPYGQDEARAGRILDRLERAAEELVRRVTDEGT
jgi:protein-tyrosine phosphatase